MVRVLQTYCNHITAAQRLTKVLDRASTGSRRPRAIPGRPPAAKQHTPEEIEEIVGLWWQCGNVAEIGRIVGAHESTVRRNLRKAGIGTAPRVLEAEDITEIGQLSEQGLSIREIENVVGWTRGSVMKGIRLYAEQIAGSARLSPTSHSQTST